MNTRRRNPRALQMLDLVSAGPRPSADDRRASGCGKRSSSVSGRVVNVMSGSATLAAAPVQQHRDPQDQGQVDGARRPRAGRGPRPFERQLAPVAPTRRASSICSSRGNPACRRSRAGRRRGGGSRCAPRRGRSRAGAAAQRQDLLGAESCSCQLSSHLRQQRQRGVLDARGLRQVDVVALLHERTVRSRASSSV